MASRSKQILLSAGGGGHLGGGADPTAACRDLAWWQTDCAARALPLAAPAHARPRALSRGNEPQAGDIRWLQALGAVARGRPLPDSYDVMWDRLCARHSKDKGDHAMIMVLLLAQEFAEDRLRTAITGTVSLGACDVGVVRHLLTEARLNKIRAAPIDVGELARYDRPMPSVIPSNHDTPSGLSKLKTFCATLCRHRAYSPVSRNCFFAEEFSPIGSGPRCTTRVRDPR